MEAEAVIAREGDFVSLAVGLRWSREAVRRLDGALVEGIHIRVEDRDGRAVAVVRATVGGLMAAKLRAANAQPASISGRGNGR